MCYQVRRNASHLKRGLLLKPLQHVQVSYACSRNVSRCCPQRTSTKKSDSAPRATVQFAGVLLLQPPRPLGHSPPNPHLQGRASAKSCLRCEHANSQSSTCLLGCQQGVVQVLHPFQLTTHSSHLHLVEHCRYTFILVRDRALLHIMPDNCCCAYLVCCEHIFILSSMVAAHSARDHCNRVGVESAKCLNAN